MYLFKGQGQIPPGDQQTTLLVLAMKYGYVVPDALLEIANEIENDTFELKERFGMATSEGPSEGILDDNPEDCIFWFSNGAYFDPETPQCIFLVGDAYKLWNRAEIWGEFLKPLQPLWNLAPEFVKRVGESLPMFGGGSTLGAANVYTYRTPNYMLSSTQNYRCNFLQKYFFT